jgi:multidrug efflux pump subunit AcrB
VEMYGGVLDADDPHAQKASHDPKKLHKEQSNIIWRIHYAFDRQFERLRRLYGGLLSFALEHRPTVVIGFAVMVLVSCCLAPLVGEDFFPDVDAGLLRLHVRCPPGTRIEQTERDFGAVEAEIRKLIPAEELGVVLDNMGIPNSTINLSLSDGSIMSPADGEILLALNSNHHPTDGYQTRLRDELPKKFPDLKFFFAPADIITQVLNFGLQAPIDVQITGPESNTDKDNQIANQILADVSKIPGIVDVRMQQVPDTPDLHVNVDRTLASEVGVQQKDVAGDLLVSLSSNVQTAPNYWYNYNNGIEYSIYVMTPQYNMDTIDQLQNTPVTPTAYASTVQDTQLLSNLATIERGVTPTNIVHYNPYQARDVLMSVAGTDLGTARDAINKVLKKYTASLPRGTQIVLRGQVQSMHSSFTALGWGLVFAIVLVYLLMVINFQSWIDPLIILMALPGALSGILWMLFVTGTTISVPALMGAIMSIGVATANSILMITFANDQRKHGMNSHDAALAAGLTRLRPVLMTALAMIIGMLPMSLGLGEGGEENAPLGRAVIGGLLLATFATLFFVPVVYSRLRHQAPETRVEPELR